MSTKKPRTKKNSHLARARKMIEGNLQKHAVLFTVSLSRAYFVNRINPKNRTSVNEYTQKIFDPDTPLYGSLQFNWKFYPVVATKDVFGNFDKLHIHDVGYDLVNVSWDNAIRAALEETNAILSKTPQKFRMNCGIIFAIDKAPMTEEKIEQIISMDENFMVWDPDREIRTSNEMDADGMELAARLEAII